VGVLALVMATQIKTLYGYFKNRQDSMISDLARQFLHDVHKATHESSTAIEV